MPLTTDPPRRAVFTFFAAVFGTTWLFQLPAILVRRGQLAGPIDRYLPLVVVGYFVPTIAALVLSRRAFGGVGVRCYCTRSARFASRPVGISSRWGIPP